MHSQNNDLWKLSPLHNEKIALNLIQIIITFIFVK